MRAYRKWFDGPLVQGANKGSSLVWQRAWGQRIEGVGLILAVLTPLLTLLILELPTTIWVRFADAFFFVGAITALSFREKLSIDPIARTFHWRRSILFVTQQERRGDLDASCFLIEESTRILDDHLGRRRVEFQTLSFHVPKSNVLLPIFRTEDWAVMDHARMLQDNLGVPVSVGCHSFSKEIDYPLLPYRQPRGVIEASETTLRMSPPPRRYLAGKIAVAMTALLAAGVGAETFQPPFIFLFIFMCVFAMGAFLPAVIDLVLGVTDLLIKLEDGSINLSTQTASGYRKHVGEIHFAEVRKLLFEPGNVAASNALTLLPAAGFGIRKILVGYDEETIRWVANWLESRQKLSRSEKRMPAPQVPGRLRNVRIAFVCLTLVLILFPLAAHLLQFLVHRSVALSPREPVTLVDALPIPPTRSPEAGGEKREHAARVAIADAKQNPTFNHWMRAGELAEEAEMAAEPYFLYASYAAQTPNEKATAKAFLAASRH